MAPLTKISVSLRRGGDKLIHYANYGKIVDEYELYQLDEDPDEMRDLYPAAPEGAARLREELMEKLREVNHRHSPA
jgi:arylsulfatase A-like enzyme